MVAGRHVLRQRPAVGDRNLVATSAGIQDLKSKRPERP
jgi:hypothetical protein